GEPRRRPAPVRIAARPRAGREDDRQPAHDRAHADQRRRGVRIFHPRRGSQIFRSSDGFADRAAAVLEKAVNARVADDERWLARILIAPAMIYIGAVIGVPFFLAIWFSVSDVTVSSTAGHFVGLENFRAQLEDPTFRAALGNTFLFAFLSQAIVIVLSSILGIALQKNFRGKWFVRLLILLPWVAPVSLGSIGWLWMLDSIYSVINWVAMHWFHVCGALHQVSCPVWLGEPRLAMTSIVAVQVWRTLPLATVILLGGLTSIPQDIHDAAAIDGAGFFRTLFQITIPLV